MNVDEYLKAFTVSYREDPAREPYEIYFTQPLFDDNDENLELAWMKTLPLIRVVFRREFANRTGREQEFSREDLESTAAASIFNCLRRKKVPPFSGRFTNWFFKDIKFRFLDAARINRQGMLPRNHVVDRTIWVQPGMWNVGRSVELKDFAESIPQATLKFVQQRIRNRFKDELYMRASKYVVLCLGSKQPPNLRILENYYGVPKPEFWVDLITVLLRQALYYIRSKYGKFLYGSSSDYINDHVQGINGDYEGTGSGLLGFHT